MSDEVQVGLCSICTGRVVVPSVWMGVVPPVPTCARCGAVRANTARYPILPMIRRVKDRRELYPSGTHPKVIEYGL